MAQRVAIVTGASRGIGAAIARRLAEDRAIVHIVYRENTSAAETVRDDIVAAGGEAHLHRRDVAVEEEIRQLVAAVAGTGGVQILVNNAGVIDDRLLMATKSESWDRLLAVNLTGPFMLCREVVPLMLDDGWGRIVNISSASVRVPGAGQCAYVAAKGGLEAFTRALAAEVGHKGIRANVVAPGAVATDMTAAVADRLGNRAEWATPEQIADVVAFLTSDAADYIQGQVITVDGGRTVTRRRPG